MMNSFKKFVWKILLKVEKVKYSGFIHCYFPVENRIVLMKISSVCRETFSAKFTSYADEEKVETMKNYGQIDNDVVFSIETREPVDVRKK